jgi:hypothetical protein
MRRHVCYLPIGFLGAGKRAQDESETMPVLECYREKLTPIGAAQAPVNVVNATTCVMASGEGQGTQTRRNGWSAHE